MTTSDFLLGVAIITIGKIIYPVHNYHFNNDAERWELMKQMMIAFPLLIFMLMLAVFVWAYFQVTTGAQ